jgi:pilus assembly protein CpaF
MTESPAIRQQADFRLSDQYQELKWGFHRHIIRVIEDGGVPIDRWSRDKLREFVLQRIQVYITENRLAVNRREANILALDTIDELVGFGPLQSLVDDSEIDDILVNGRDQIYVERHGMLETAPVRFIDDQHVIRVIQRILAPLGRRVDESTPMVDARLPDGSRVNAVIPPIALNGPCVSIRKFRKDPLGAEELAGLGALSSAMLDFLRISVHRKTSLMIIGGTGSGKTTLLNVLSQFVPPGERIITIEDAAELRLKHGHVVRMETRPPNLEGEGEVTARDLVRNALRMRPDRIIVGEVRGHEILDMLQAMNTGHDGSMTTLHANNPKDAVHRLELLAAFAGFKGDSQMFRQQIASALDMLVHVSRLPSGRRRVMAIVQVAEGQDGTLLLRDLFRFDPTKDEFRDCRNPREAGPTAPGEAV